MSISMNRFGIRDTLGTMSLLLKVIQDPGRYLSQHLVEEKDLAAVLAMVWRVLLIAKLIGMLPWSVRLTEAGLLVLVFLTARHLARVALKLCAPPINGLVRMIRGGNDLMAAKRAIAFTSIFPNPLLCLYLLSPTIGKHFGPVASTFVLYGFCGVAGTVLFWLAVAKAYRLSSGRAVLLVLAPVMSTMVLVFQIPFYLSDRFSPTVVKDDVDFAVLELHRSALDSSADGSGFMERELLDLAAMDTVELDSAFSKKTLPDARMGKALARGYRELAPLLKATYFDKRKLKPILPEFPVGAESLVVSPANAFRQFRYGKILYLYAAYCISVSDFRKAEEVIKEALEFTDALGYSNLGLVSSVQQSVLARKFSDLIAANSPGWKDPPLLRRYADLLLLHRVDPQCVLNSLRQEYYQLDATMRISSAKAFANWRRVADSVGFHMPGYTWRKFWDPEETREISAYLWAKTITAAARPGRDSIEPLSESMQLMRWRNSWRALVYKNTFGRVWLGVSTPMYQGYGRGILDNRRHTEATYAALVLRARLLETGKAPSLSDLSDFFGIPGSPGLSGPYRDLMFRDTFSIRNDTLISADSLRFKDEFAIALR